MKPLKTPETIREVYGIDVTVEHNADTGLMNIAYHPNFRKGRKA